MGEDFGSWFPLMHLGWQPPDPNSGGSPLGLGHQNFYSAYVNPGTNMLSTNGVLPAYASSELLHPQVGRPSEPHGWFYCLPRIRQAFMPPAHSVLEEKLSACCHESPGQTLVPNAQVCEQKKFLLKNPSADQTTLIHGSGIVNPMQCHSFWNPIPNQQGVSYFNGDDPRTERELKNLSGPGLTDELNGNDETGAQSEMHEDTEELNALLYSDGDSDYTEDDEVTSTGHSPSTMTVQGKPNWLEERNEEVASSNGITRKRKLFDGGYGDVPFVMETASSMKLNRSLELEDDAESSCACNRTFELREVDSISSNKKMRKEKIRETVNILQNLIPGSKGKDAIVVLDQAISYLKSLRLKVEAFGLDSL